MVDMISVGDRVEITFKRDKNHQKTYVSMIEHVINEKQLMMHMPISYGKIIKLPTGEEYEITVYTDSGMILFDANIDSYTKEDGFNYMVMNLLTAGEKKQRRDFFRFDCLLPLQFTYYDADNVESGKCQGIVKDIGGGGLRFVSNEDLPEGKHKFKGIVMLKDDFVITTGDILFKQVFPKSNYKFQYRVKFSGLTQDEREKIIKYIFDEQRRIMQRRKV